MKRLAILFSALLAIATTSAPVRAADLDQVGWIWPSTDPAKMALGEGEALVVVGYSLRGVEANGFGVPFPIHVAWMPFGQIGERIGKEMLVTVERCGRDVSQACNSVQYRAYRVPAGNYSLAWAFSDKLFPFAKFDHADIRANRNTHEILAADFSDKAMVQVGVRGFEAQAGDIVYIGDLVVNFEKGKYPSASWSTTTRDEATVAAIMQTTPFGDRLVVRQAGYLGE